MDTRCKSLLEKYIKSESAIACLELSGYTSDALIKNLDNNQIDQIEDFVRHACSVMSTNSSRLYLGNVFSSHPNKFCFPIGVRMGIMMAVNELKTLNVSPPLKEVAVQTDAIIKEDSIKRSQFPKEPNIEEPSCNSVDLTNEDNSQATISLSFQSQLTLAEQYATQLEHLRAHSSASAVRLVSRQFVNARLIPGHNFNIDMEIVPSSDGNGARITGIYQCHLCRERRTRSTAVRFSVSRNRYPVMSNVLSHLKIHFQARSASSVTPASVKRETAACSDSSAGLDSLSPFNLDHLLTNNVPLSADGKL